MQQANDVGHELVGKAGACTRAKYKVSGHARNMIAASDHSCGLDSDVFAASRGKRALTNLPAVGAQ
jgi:hypothetical protein